VKKQDTTQENINKYSSFFKRFTIMYGETLLCHVGSLGCIDAAQSAILLSNVEPEIDVPAKITLQVGIPFPNLYIEYSLIVSPSA
jgi:hypothetical protein